MAPAAVMCPFNAATVGIPSVKIPQGSTGGKVGHSQVIDYYPLVIKHGSLKFCVDDVLMGNAP